MWKSEILLETLRYSSSKRRKVGESSSSEEASSSIEPSSSTEPPSNITTFFNEYLGMLSTAGPNMDHYKKFSEFGTWFYKPKEHVLKDYDYGQPKECAENSLTLSI